MSGGMQAARLRSGLMGVSLLLGAAVRPMDAQGGRVAAPTPEQIAAAGRRSTVTIVAIDAAGDTVRQGSGVILRADGVVATNWHVMQGASSARIRLANGEVIDRVLFLDGDSLADIALLRVAGLDMPAARTTTDVPAVGTRVLAIGAPLGLSQTVSDGLVSAIRLVDGKTVIQTTAAISPGSSGGPVFDAQGRVFAIAMSTLSEGQALNFATPIRYGLALLPLASTPRSLVSVFASGGAPATPHARTASPPPTAPTAAPAVDRNGLLRLPERTTRPDTSIAGTFVVEHQLVTTAAPQRIRTGLIVLDHKGNGWFMTDRHDEGTGIAVFDAVTTRTGRVGFSLAGSETVGYQTDQGFAGIWSDKRTPTDTIRMVARWVDLSLAQPDGLYDLEGRLSYWPERNRRNASASGRWWGSATVVSTSDSAWITVELTNESGGTTAVIAEVQRRSNGTFAWRDEKSGDAMDGRISAGSIEIDWIDSRDSGSSFRGRLTGRRR
jgi:hypothetical protein